MTIACLPVKNCAPNSLQCCPMPAAASWPSRQSWLKNPEKTMFCWQKAIAFAVAGLAFGCGSLVNAPTPAATDDTGGAEVGVLDSTKPDAGVDATIAETAAPSDVIPDSGLTTEVADNCPGGQGCTCKENGDCNNAQCIDISSGKVCATKCVDKCEDGYKCALINGNGGDSVTICVPKYLHLCDPCSKSKDCQSLGLSDAACVAEGGQGNFCGTACTVDGDCAASYTCQSVISVEGAPVKQCAKASTAPELKYGECTCTELAVAAKLQTSCFVEHKNDKGELLGKCAGVRACGASGLTTCAAPALDVEVCDGKDNDCDGLTDEATCDAGGACNVGTCNAQSGCQYNKLNNVPCDADKNACTDNDQCKLGICVPGPGKVCDDGNPCTTDSCDPASGCTKTVDDGKPCDADGNACTAADHCEGATCTPGKVVVCDNTNTCSKASCDAVSGKCVGKAMQDGAPCDDKTVCTQADVCKTGDCVGKIVSCDDNNPCTGNSCDPVTGCNTTNLDGIACDDDNLCTIGDLCKVGVCAKGALKVCDSGMECTIGSCSLVTGKCDYKNKLANAPCNDGDSCSENDGCIDGNCQGKVVSCDDSNPCTNDSCDKVTGCAHKNNTSPCSDGDACTASDKCADGACVAGVAKVCADDKLCTADSCNKTSGNCVFDALAMNGTPCDDGNVCTIGDACGNGSCSVGIIKDCNDNNVCSDDLCDKAKGCNPNFNSKACDDSNACTKGDICKFGDCEGSLISCNDSNPCTDDACDPKKGCVNAANSLICNDGNACTEKDQCKNNACGGSPVNCDDNNVCSDDSCDKGSGCLNAPNVALCADADACTTGEQCKAMNCTKKAVVCTDSNACTTDTCDAVKGCQYANVADKTDCGGGMVCLAGKCSSGCIPGQQTFNFTGSLQNFVMPSCTNLTIEAAGGAGGNGGGLGAKMKGTFSVATGVKLNIVVGGIGLDSTGQVQNSGGGAGGSFVYDVNNVLLMAAGGGGGKCKYAGSPALSANAGGSVALNGNPSSEGNAGGVGGLGGTGSSWGSSGAGWLGDGVNASQGGGGTGGKSKFTFAGGTGLCTGGGGGCGGAGNYGGGGGGGNAYGGGGGGGGYSGGGAGGDPHHGGGGGSYNNGSNQTNTPNTQSGNGFVTVTWN